MQPYYTEKAQAALKLAEKSAAGLKQGYVGTEHILLGLVMEGTSVAARILSENGITAKKITDLIKELISFNDNSIVGIKDREGYSPRALKVLEEAHMQAERFEQDK